VPELPEVETIRRQLAPRLTGRRVVEAWGQPGVKFASAASAAGASITTVHRRGKYLLAALDDRRELVVHLGMTGKLRLRPEGPIDRFVRAWWRLEDGEVVELHDVRQFGRVAVVDAGCYAALPTLAALGPEPFDDEFTPEALWRGLRRGRRRVKTRLVDQSLVAGVGNIYADEALWLARVSPVARAVSRPRAEALHGALREVLQRGLDNGGTTLRDYRGFDGTQGSNQHALACYGRAGLPCLHCGTTLRRRVVDARGTTWCPTCQSR
jgi:formamidopyrimidine-DNA glycosylase